MPLLFAYGSLMSGLWNNIFLENAVYLGSYTTTEKYIFVMDGKVPYMSREKQAYHIVGELYDVSECDLETIDSHEGNGAWYDREELTLRSNDADSQNLTHTLTAHAYFNDNGEGIMYSCGDYRKYLAEIITQNA